MDETRRGPGTARDHRERLCLDALNAAGEASGTPLIFCMTLSTKRAREVIGSDASCP